MYTRILSAAVCLLALGCNPYRNIPVDDGDNPGADERNTCANSASSRARQCEFIVLDRNMCPSRQAFNALTSTWEPFTETRFADSTNDFRTCIDEGDRNNLGYTNLGVDRLRRVEVTWREDGELNTQTFVLVAGFRDYNGDGTYDNFECLLENHDIAAAQIVSSDDLGAFDGSACD